MIKSLRRKFIRITMITVFSVLLLIISAVNIVNVYQNNRSLDSVTELIMENGGSFMKNPEPFDKLKPEFAVGEPEFDDRFHNKKELSYSTRFFTVTTDRQGLIIKCDLTSIASVTEEEIPQFAEMILDKNVEVGWIESYRYRVKETENGYFIIVMEATASRSSILSVFVITLLVGLIAFLLVFILVTIFSNQAIKPILKTYEKQKQFITDASHELKTPLTIISADAEIIALTYGQNEWCDGIEKQTGLMRGLIGKMIEMSRLDEGDGKLVFEKFDLSDAVYDTSMTFLAIAEKKGLIMEIDTEPDLYLNGDEAAVRQATAILNDNAVKYCDAGGKISVSAFSKKEFGKEHIVISVKNTLSSVNDIDVEKIFERFYREDKSRSSSHSYGLGLPIARAITEKHGGKLQAEKRDNALEFIIDIPKK